MTHAYPAYLQIVLILTSLGGARPGHAQDQRFVHWIGATDPEETRGNTVFRYTLESGLIDTLVQASELGPDMPQYYNYVTVDTLRGQIYWTASSWTDSTGNVYIGTIMHASLNGDNPEIFLGGIVCGIGAAQDIEIDAVGETLFWAEFSDCSDSALNSVSLENSNPDEWQGLPTNGINDMVGIVLDVRHQMIYWSNYDWQEPPRKTIGIYRAALSSTTTTEVIIAGTMWDLALSHTSSKIYWTPRDSSIIQRANLDGSEIENVIASPGDPSYLAIDDLGRKIYWTEKNAGRLMRANLDGSDLEELLTGLVVPTSLALNFGWDVSVTVEPEEEIPDRVQLQSLYPNPVRESTTIVFDIAEPAHVTLEIYDLLGRREVVLASRMYPPGMFQVQWNPTDQANGVYFCRMVSYNSSKTIPLVLQR